MPILYNCRSTADGWMMAKFDEDFNVAGVYTIKTEGKPPKMICDCPGWPRKQVCKHTRMVNTFALSGHINSPAFYCYETQQWHQPIPAGPWDTDSPTAARAAEAAGPAMTTPIPTPAQPSQPKPMRRI